MKEPASKPGVHSVSTLCPLPLSSNMRGEPSWRNENIRGWRIVYPTLCSPVIVFALGGSSMEQLMSSGGSRWRRSQLTVEGGGGRVYRKSGNHHHHPHRWPVIDTGIGD